MIRFSSEEARLSHPYGCLVNSFLMGKYFNNALTTTELELLNNTLGKVDFLNLLTRATEAEQLKLLLCAFCAKQHAQVSLDDDLTRIRGRVSDEVISKALALTGDFDSIGSLGVAEAALIKNIQG